MTLFMVAALPLTLGLILYAYYPDELKNMAFWLSFLKGVLVWIVAFILYLLIENLLNDAFTFGKLFAVHLVHDFAFFFAATIAGYVVVFRAKSPPGTEYAMFPRILAFVAGSQVLLSVADLILKSGWFETYSLFLLPVVRTCLCIIVALILNRSAISYGPMKYVLLASAILPPIALTTIPALFSVHQYIAGGSVSAFSLAATIAALFFARRARV